jgi:hydroxymethylpyrimidine pyrophosphatase-like HAD family hydrolase
VLSRFLFFAVFFFSASFLRLLSIVMWRSLWRRSPAGAVKAAAKFRFVASDMDGTILTPQHTLSEFTSETLRRLTQDRQVPFVFATGRFYADVAAVNRDLQKFFYQRRLSLPPVPASTLQSTPTYIITSNGAVIHNAETGEVVLERPVDPLLAREIYHMLPPSETRINTGMIHGDSWLYRMDWTEMLQFHKQSGCRYEVVPRLPDNVQTVSLDHVYKLFFSCWDRPLLEKLEHTLQQRYGTELTVTFSSSYNVDITAKNVTKASALRSLFEHMGQLPNETPQEATSSERLKSTVAFGDDLNDAAMLTEVGRGFIMGNCNPQLKVRCPQLEVIDTNGTDAVARKIRDVFALE